MDKDIIEGIDTAIILVDDFIGSGKSFEKAYNTKIKLREWMDTKAFIKDRFLLASVCMKEGEQYIRTKYPEIKIYSEFREKIFNPITSPFRVKKNIAAMKSIATAYGKQIATGRYPIYTPLGFDNSEALIAFSHTTPNNTLPIIWGKFQMVSNVSKIR